MQNKETYKLQYVSLTSQLPKSLFTMFWLLWIIVSQIRAYKYLRKTHWKPKWPSTTYQPHFSPAKLSLSHSSLWLHPSKKWPLRNHPLTLPEMAVDFVCKSIRGPKTLHLWLFLGVKRLQPIHTLMSYTQQQAWFLDSLDCYMMVGRLATIMY